MSLLERQIVFRDEIAAEEGAAPPSSPGMAIYREAYRARLLGALETSFERTRRWVGESAFIAAASHYILTVPPTGWTLDEYGADFPGVLAELFAQDPEVAELAWLEWHRQQAFAAKDAPQLDPVALAAAGYSEQDWEQMRFAMAAGFAARRIATNCVELWAALAEGDAADFAVTHDAGTALLVWRHSFAPRHRIAASDEGHALMRIAQGATLGEVAEDANAPKLGQWLTQWLTEGMFAEAGCELKPAYSEAALSVG